MKTDFLTLAGLLSFIASALHICIIFADPSWYITFGAGARMAELAQQGSLEPTLITVSIAVVLAIWGLYAWSGTRMIRKLPLLKTGLIIITTIYLIRGLAGLILPHITTHPMITQNSDSFWLVSSIVCLIYASVHIIGLLQNWKKL